MDRRKDTGLSVSSASRGSVFPQQVGSWGQEQSELMPACKDACLQVVFSGKTEQTCQIHVSIFFL